MPGKNSDLYGDADPAENTATPAAKPDEQGTQATATLPKTLLAGKEFKPGEKIVLRITAIHDDEVEVEYAADEGGEKEPEAAPKEAPAPAQAPSSMFE